MKTEQETELEVVAPIEAQLIAYAGQTGLEQSSTTPLVAAFRPIFVKAKMALAESLGVAESVKDATCVSEIKKARACRLAIRAIRIEGASIHKAQKATALAYGRAVDGFHNILLADLAPVEKALQDAEDTAERAETARKDALEAGRKSALSSFVSDVALYAVRDMAEPAFAALLTGVKVAKEQADAAVAKAEADRIAKEKADAAERERVRAENERLKQKAIDREAAAKAERDLAEKKLAEERAEAARVAAAEKARADAEAKAAADKAAKERAALEAKAKAEREALEAKHKAEQAATFAAAETERKRAAEEKAAAYDLAAKERAAREKAEAQAKALREANEKKIRAEAIAAKKAACAPDRTKLAAYWSGLDGVRRPDMATDEGAAIMAEMDRRMHDLAKWLEAQANTLG